MKKDNSCLFSSVSYCLKNSTDCSKSLRTRCSKAVLQKPMRSHHLMGKSPKEYSNWIAKSPNWGGAVELDLMADFLGIDIVVFDQIKSRKYSFGAGDGNRIYLCFYKSLKIEKIMKTKTITMRLFLSVKTGGEERFWAVMRPRLQRGWSKSRFLKGDHCNTLSTRDLFKH